MKLFDFFILTATIFFMFVSIYGVVLAITARECQCAPLVQSLEIQKEFDTAIEKVPVQIN